MKKKLLLGALCLLPLALAKKVVGFHSRPAPPASPDGDDDRSNSSIARATQAYLVGVVLPLWVLFGFGDWICHRRSKIERTSGTHESLTHALMMTSLGIPTLMALLFEINAAVILALAGGFFVHEGIVLWDVAYANPRRKTSNAELHIHSFLEVLPFMSLSFISCLYWDQALALLGASPSSPDFSLRFKRSPLAWAALAAVLTGSTGLIAIPYAEELMRCYAVDHTFMPHPAPPGGTNA